MKAKQLQLDFDMLQLIEPWPTRHDLVKQYKPEAKGIRGDQFFDNIKLLPGQQVYILCEECEELGYCRKRREENEIKEVEVADGALLSNCKNINNGKIMF